MKISDLNQKVFIQKLSPGSNFYDDDGEIEDMFPIFCRVIDKGVTETDNNGHVHEARELLVIMRSYEKTRAIRPDLYQLLYRDELYDITHVELDSIISRYITLHARRRSHAGSRSTSPS